MTTRTVIFSNESLSKLQDRDKCIGTCSGIARFFDAWNEQTRWPPLTEITNLKKKKSQLGGELSKMTCHFNVANKNYSVII